MCVVETVSVRFRLGDFMEDLNNALLYNPNKIDDIVQTYKDFLTRVDEPLLSNVKAYVRDHYLFTSNERIESFISACYR